MVQLNIIRTPFYNYTADQTKVLLMYSGFDWAYLTQLGEVIYFLCC